MACSYYVGAGLRFSSAIMLSWDDFLWEDWVENKTKFGKCNIRAKGDKDAVLVVDPILMNRLYNLAERSGNLFMGIPYKNSVKDLYLFVKRVELEALEGLYKKQNFENVLDSKVEQINVKERSKVEMIRVKHYLVDYKLRKLSTFFNGKHIKFHSLRHSRATNLLKKGFKLMTIKEQLMHNSISTTEIYLNLSNVDIEDEFNEKL
jgi:integrase